MNFNRRNFLKTTTISSGLLLLPFSLEKKLWGLESSGSLLKDKQAFLDKLRLGFSKTGHRGWEVKKLIKKGLKSLNKEVSKEGTLIGKPIEEKSLPTYCRYAWALSKLSKGKNESDGEIYGVVKKKIYNMVINIHRLETAKPNSYKRFHFSCFAIPNTFVNVYFYNFKDMVGVEKGTIKDPLIVKGHDVIVELAKQAWTQPYRNDETDKNPFQIARFKGHVWWVTANAITYRPVYPVAVALNSIVGIDVLVEVCNRAIDFLYPGNKKDPFWEEGFTSDGLGWGHGTQNYTFGYPAQGVQALLDMKKNFLNSPWDKGSREQTRTNVKIFYVLKAFVRGSQWMRYKGFIHPVTGRNCKQYVEPKARDASKSKFVGILKNILNHFVDYLPSVIKDKQKFGVYEKEILDLKKEMKSKTGVFMDDYKGVYTGTKYFWCNDLMIRKSRNFYCTINMASSRVSGIEFGSDDKNQNDMYHYHSAAGSTFFSKEGYEACHALGGHNLTALPGVTAKRGENSDIFSITTWKGFNSFHNFCGGTGLRGRNACCGFIQEFNPGNEKIESLPEVVMGVYVKKGYFIFDDMMLALGTGIKLTSSGSNKFPICTTVETAYFENPITVTENGKSKTYDTTKKNNVNFVLKKSKTDALNWIEQENKFAYAPLSKHNKSAVEVEIGDRKTIWNRQSYPNQKKKNLPKNMNVLDIRINHGKSPFKGGYAYLVYMGDKKASQSFKTSPIQVISNSSKVQAALYSNGKNSQVVQAVFYKSSTLEITKDFKIKATMPCIFTFEEENGSVKVTLCDPLFDVSLKSIKISITKPIEGKAVKKKKKWYEINLKSARKPYVGRPVSANFKLV